MSTMEKLLRYVGKDIQNITFNSWLERKPPELRPLAIRWFRVIQNCGDDVQPIFHDGYPMGCVDDAPFAYVNVFKAHVNVGFFYGVDLIDKTGLLTGTGKRMRHVKLLPGLKHDDTEIELLIDAAYADIKQRLGSSYREFKLNQNEKSNSSHQHER
jgi:hypothetical protein